MRPSVKFVPLAEMAEKWSYSEDEMIQFAIQKEFNLYCLKPIPSKFGDPLRIPFFLGDELSDFLPGKTSISCSQYYSKTSDYEEGTFVPNSPEDRRFAEMYRVGRPEFDPPSVTVDRSDLFLHQDEIAKMEKKYPKLGEEIAKNETNLKPEESNRETQSNPRGKETTNLPIIGGTIDLLLSRDDSESVSTSTNDLETVSAVDNQFSFPGEIVNKTNLIAQIKKPNSAKQPNKKKEKTDLHIIDECTEPFLQSKDDKELPTKTQAGPKIRYLRLWEIIGDKKKKIQPIISVSKTTWWAGVKSGLYPKPVKLSKRCTAWIASEIFALQEVMEKERNNRSTVQLKDG